MQNDFLAISFALTSALLIAVGTVWRHRILRAGRSTTEVNPAPLASLRRPAWWASVALALAAYGFQALALAFGSLLVVQPILVLSLMFTLLLSARVEHRRMSAQGTAWATLLTIFVAVVILVGRPVPGTAPPGLVGWVLAIGFGVAWMVGTVMFARTRGAATQALAYGILCGAIFGYLAVFSKVAVDAYVHGGIVGLVESWQFWAMLACAVLGTAVQQFAFGASKLATTLPAMKVVEPLVALTLGIVLLGENFAVSTVGGWVAMVASIIMMLASAAMLTRTSIQVG